MTVRTTLLARRKHVTGGTHELLYTCPTGITAIVKDICLTNLDTVARLMVVDHGNGESWLFGASVPGTSVVTSAGRFVVLLPGDTLYSFAAATSGGSMWFEVSGTELDGVAP